MKRLYPTILKAPLGEVGFSKNGAAAYAQGERPLFLWPEKERESLLKTINHHVEITARARTRRMLLMFYRRPITAEIPLDPDVQTC
jgi:hypothetical protein